MDAVAKQGLMRRLGDAGVDVAGVAASGGGIWCFGSRAAGCARADSDWDVLVMSSSPMPEHRIRRVGLDLVSVRIGELEAWASTELAAHVAFYGVRIDRGPEITLCAAPAAAAPRKCATVGGRAGALDALWAGLQPAQRRHEALRLRLDLHRAWLLTKGAAIPPTALLEREWRSSPRLRAAILALLPLPRTLARAVARSDG